ncbi:MAG: Uma2 family endonuclease [Deltaproteobacteria bacterium]|nr:Uma2 family endonuclease [Deltaproteobacteria bacterium]
MLRPLYFTSVKISRGVAVLSPSSQVRQWTRQEYEKMVPAGIFHPEERLELIEGDIYRLTPQSSLHATTVRAVEKMLTQLICGDYDVRGQMPLALDMDSEPEPDVAVVPGNFSDYRQHHPTTAVLVVEVADSSLYFDRGVKKGLYARNNIPEYWLINLVAGCLEVYRRPDQGAYQDQAVLYPGETVSPLVFSQRSVAVAALLQ